jgi:hypothetical protein
MVLIVLRQSFEFFEGKLGIGREPDDSAVEAFLYDRLCDPEVELLIRNFGLGNLLRAFELTDYW